MLSGRVRLPPCNCDKAALFSKYIAVLNLVPK